MSHQNKQLLVWLFWAFVAFNVLYHYWLFIMGAFAVYGVCYALSEYNRNKNH